MCYSTPCHITCTWFYICYPFVVGVIEKYVNILDSKGKSKILMRVYAGVNQKDVKDPDLQLFFKFRCWI